jgi:probable HAF family extracellular repeat protein
MEDLSAGLVGYSVMYGINDAGWAVGSVTHNNADTAILFDGSGPTRDISTVFAAVATTSSPGTLASVAHAVNNNGRITGWRTVLGGSPFVFGDRAFVMDPVGVSSFDITPLPGGSYSRGFGINDNGQVAGEADTAAGFPHAFVFTDSNGNGAVDSGEMVDLGTGSSNQSRANAINHDGIAVGFAGAHDVLYGDSQAYMFPPGKPGIALNSLVPCSGWNLREATAINDQGQIVGFMEDFNTDAQARVRHAFRLDPPPRPLPTEQLNPNAVPTVSFPVSVP